MLMIGDEVEILNDGGQYTGVRDPAWLDGVLYYDPLNHKGFVGETAIVTKFIEYSNADDGCVYAITLPSGEELFYEEFSAYDEFDGPSLKKVQK